MSSHSQRNVYHHNPPQRRGAVDYGAPPPILYATPRMANHHALSHLRPPSMATINPVATMHRPTPLPKRSADAPSRSNIHPYTLLQFFACRRDTEDPPPAPCDCAPCKADSFMATASERWHRPFRVSPDDVFKGPPIGNPNLVEFAVIGATMETPPGVRVSDILGFRNCMLHPEYKLVPCTPGPLKVTFRIQGVWPAKETIHTFTDVIFASCKHRDITRFNLGWWLAFQLRYLVQHTEGLGTIEDLYLVSLYTPDGAEYHATARWIK
ncbi:hypothetical protein B0H11DRAFT_2295621 [Mycena galericulata]|nr:hypothetical protein B0H11DRAFT_2295621 [Mycena galericulata]